MIMTIKESIRYGYIDLNDVGIDTAQLDSEILLAFSLKIRKEALFLEPDFCLSSDEFTYFKTLINRRKKFEPIAYIINNKDFYGHEFYVDNNVLIPRPDTEILVEEVLETAKLIDKKPITIVDIGTGSGSIGITLNLEIPYSKVLGIDIDEKALEVAKKNAIKLNSPDIEFIQSDLLSDIKIHTTDILVANLPYIPDSESKSMMPDVIQYEPKKALFSGKDGLREYKRLFEQIKEIDINHIFIEMFYTQTDEILSLIAENFPESKSKVINDLGGRNRVIYIGKTINLDQ